MLLLFEHMIILAICLALKIVGINEDVMGIVFVALSCIVIIVYIFRMSNVDKSIKLILLIGFITRIICVFIDVFVTRLPDAGTDDDGFYQTSLLIYNNNYTNMAEITRGGIFPKVLSILYFIIGSSRFSVQYVNVLLCAISAIVFIRTLQNFRVDNKYQRIAVAILYLMPNAILFNSILRRETVIELFICTSLYFLSEWNKNKKSLNAFYSVIFIALASLFHTAFIFGVPIYIIYFALYDKRKKAVSFSINKISKMVILLICAVFLGIGFLSLWKNKLTSVTEMDDIYFTTNRASGGSVYLENVKVNSVGQLVLFTPLKLFYFLFSPVPWKFRNIMDVVSFILDALVYLCLIIIVVKNPKNSISKMIFASFILFSAIFALGTFNSGTAIRHRFSLLPFLLVSCSLVQSDNSKNKLSLDGQKTIIDKAITIR